MVVEGLEDVEEGSFGCRGVQRVHKVAATLLTAVVGIGHEGLVLR